jgi:hypothetical protein
VEREVRAGDRLPDGAREERPPFTDRLARQPGDRHDPQDLGDRVLFEYGLVVAGRQLHPITIHGALLDRPRGDPLRIKGARA